MSELDVTDGRGPWKQFICRACGLIYNEGEGDPDSGLAPGTRFEDIPDDWECPLCGVTKTDFEPYVRRERPVTAGAPRDKRARQPGIVIVGAGTAGWSAAEAVRELSPNIPITMVTGDAGNRYNKPELSVALSRGLSPEQLCRQTGAEAAAELNIRLMPQTTAVGLSAAQHRLRTTRGSIPYKSLILALGARPALPPSLPPELCWRVNDLNAWIGLRRQLGDAPREVAVVGAGMVGCEIAEDLARSGHSVILLNNSPLPLQRLLPDIASERIVRGLSGLGIRFFGGVRATAARREGSDTICLSTDCGLAFEPQVVIAATGLATETRLVRTAGLAFNQGIAVCHDTLCSSIPDVYALGDCISIDGTPCRYIEPIARQAEAIAHAVLGQEHTGYQHAPPIIRLKTKSTPLVIKGVPIENGNWRVIEDSEERLLMEQWHDNKLMARLAA